MDVGQYADSFTSLEDDRRGPELDILDTNGRAVKKPRVPIHVQPSLSKY